MLLVQVAAAQGQHDVRRTHDGELVVSGAAVDVGLGHEQRGPVPAKQRSKTRCYARSWLYHQCGTHELLGPDATRPEFGALDGLLPVPQTVREMEATGAFEGDTGRTNHCRQALTSSAGVTQNCVASTRAKQLRRTSIGRNVRRFWHTLEIPVPGPDWTASDARGHEMIEPRYDCFESSSCSARSDVAVYGLSPSVASPRRLRWL
eukprot:COSAG01_NODE_8129_length_2911_cov_2.827525_4_plen_204_part_01